ncbi:MAG TPA: helix-hairpin-helix domain-containing protein, partial [Thermoanaerobaculia bacterium]|nr:helix-hairpin-helix domain-containing protein [Thermoanaerobaculia bacterium]
MQKKDVALALEEIGRYLDLGDPSNRFRALAYRKAASAVEALEDNLEDAISSGRLEQTPGIGKATGAAIRELVMKGRSIQLEELRAAYPPGILDLIRVPGLGMKKVAMLHHELGISSIEDLERAIEEGSIDGLAGFGPRSREKIAKGLKTLRSSGGRMLLPKAIEIVDRLTLRIQAVKGVIEVRAAGAIRRRVEVVDRIDLLVVTETIARTAKAIESLELPEMPRRSGPALLRGEAKGALPVEIVLCPPAESCTRLFFLTGSEEFVTSVTDRAANRGVELTPAGIVRNGESAIIPKTEDEIFRLAGVPPVPPELRESAEWTGRKPPRTLVDVPHLQGTFHVHTTWSDGRHSLRDMVRAARAVGFRYVGISDHSKTASYAGGLSEERVDQQQAEIAAVEKEQDGIRLFRGTECDILP